MDLVHPNRSAPAHCILQLDTDNNAKRDRLIEMATHMAKQAVVSCVAEGAVHFHPTDPCSWGAKTFYQNERYKDAQTSYGLAMKISKRLTTPFYRVVVLHLVGQVFSEHERWPWALEVYRTAERLMIQDPSHMLPLMIPVWINLSNVLYEIHDHKSALEIMYLATELCSETYGLESKMAVGLFSQYGSVSLLSALYMVEDLHALFVLGQMFQKAQQYELAVEVYDLLMSWAPPDDYSQLNVAAACVNKGVALLCLEKTKESILSFEKAISVIRSIDPKHPAMAFAMRNLSAVRKLQGQHLLSDALRKKAQTLLPLLSIDCS